MRSKDIRSRLAWAGLFAVLFLTGCLGTRSLMRRYGSEGPFLVVELLPAVAGAGCATVALFLTLPALASAGGPQSSKLRADLAAMATLRYLALAESRSQRDRLQRDLHDGIGPVLASVRMHTDLLRTLVLRDPKAAAALLDDFSSATEDAVGEVRKVLRELSEPSVGRMDLVAALEERVAVLARAAGDRMGFVLQAPADPLTLPEDLARNAYLVVNEALTNAVKHAEARRVVVRVAQGPGAELTVEVTDDGVGFGGDQVGVPSSGGDGHGIGLGIGLDSIRRRAEALGGCAEFGPAGDAPDRTGTRVRARFPLPSGHLEHAAAAPR
ncbi:sensor histidine kinase [Streptomyces sp. NPDC002851]